MNRRIPGLPVHHQLLEFTQTHVHQVSYAIQPLHPLPFFSCLQSFTASRSFPMSKFFVSGSQSIGVSTSSSVLPMNIQDWFPLGLMVWFPWHLRDSQESSPIPQFKSINSLALSFLYSSTLISIHDYWKKPKLWLDEHLLAKSCLCFSICCLGWS